MNNFFLSKLQTIKKSKNTIFIFQHKNISISFSVTIIVVFALAVKGKKTCVHQEVSNSNFTIFTIPLLWDAVFQRDMIFNSNPNRKYVSSLKNNTLMCCTVILFFLCQLIIILLIKHTLLIYIFKANIHSCSWMCNE